MDTTGRIDCCVPGCTSNLEFGGATKGVVKAMGGKDAAVAGMAIQIGWTPTVMGWRCREHG